MSKKVSPKHILTAYRNTMAGLVKSMVILLAFVLAVPVAVHAQMDAE